MVREARSILAKCFTGVKISSSKRSNCKIQKLRSDGEQLTESQNKRMQRISKMLFIFIAVTFVLIRCARFAVHELICFLMVLVHEVTYVLIHCALFVAHELICFLLVHVREVTYMLICCALFVVHELPCLLMVHVHEVTYG